MNKLFFWPFTFFNADIKSKRPSHPIVTTTEKTQRQNAGIPESKALFVVYKDEWSKRLLHGYNRQVVLTQISYSFDEACLNPVAVSKEK